jgi:integrase
MEVDCKVARRQRKHGEVTVYKPKGEKHWYYRVLIHGKRRNRTTHHTDKKLALMQAKIIAKSLLTGGDARETMARPGYATVGDVCRVWLEMSEAMTRKNNASAFRKFVRSFAGGDPDGVSMTRCSAGAFEKYLRAWPGAHEGRKSTARQIRVMFGKKPMRWYRHEGLVLPDMSEFCEVMAENVKGEARQKFQGIESVTLARMEAAAEQLRMSADLEERKLWAVWALMRWCGLRNIEVAALRWSWIKRGAKHWEIRVLEYSYADGTKFAPKKSAGVVPIRRRVLGQLLRALGRDGEFVIPRGNPTEAKILTSRTINGFMRPFFPEAGPKEKKAYLLRKQSGSEVAQKYGLTAMATFLRQKGIKTAWDNYHAQLQPLSPL